MTAREEQETTVAIGRDDSVVRIYTNVTPHLYRLRKSDLATEVAGGDDWGQFEIPVEFFHLFSALRRKRAVSDAQREAARDRFAAARTAVSS